MVIPKVYDGRNKTFFLAGFQRQHSKETNSTISDVPNPAMLAGDFSFGGLGDPIYDPASLTRLPNGNYSRETFPGNRVPLSRFDPAVRKFLDLKPWSAEHDPFGQAYVNRTGPHDNLNADSRYRSFRTGIDFKIDQSLSDYHKLFGRYSNLRNRADGGDWQPQIANKLFDYNFTPVPNDFRQVVISDSLTLNPTTINEVRIGFNRRKHSRSPETLNQDMAGQLGIPNAGPETMPSFLNSGGGNLYGRLPEGPQKDVTENFSLQENFTMVRGRHTFKTGYELLRTRANSLLNAQP
ncbi:MAG: hypothetical protein IT158_23780 [Bryobacterales bacterium]|nr:hypothetical protein [Bryobacterales bacterium]